MATNRQDMPGQGGKKQRQSPEEEARAQHEQHCLAVGGLAQVVEGFLAQACRVACET